MTVAVRRARPGDVPVLARLATEAAGAVAAQRGGEMLLADHLRPVDAGARLAVDADGGIGGRQVAVGLIGEVVVGYASLEVVEIDGGRLGRIHEILTEPAARGCGVGAAMLRWCIETAEDAGCRGLDAVALPGDRASKNFFEAHGLTARLIVVQRPIDGAP